ncbi:MAG: ribonuclease HII [Bacilli bacterium]|nr:ribonuclease HII [Bacilli bacterium]
MANLDYERQLLQKGYKRIAGVDEAGRGPLAGPLVVASVILKEGYSNENINDSKKLTDKKRRMLFNEIINNSLSYCIIVVDNQIVDKLNIYEATKQAMISSLKEVDCDYALVDAMKLEIDNYLPLIKGDAKSTSIAAASILAKVYRDDLMLAYDKLYPQYDFKHNKGYGSKKHLEALDQFGPCKIHRLSYKPVRDSLNPRLELF